MVIRQMLHYQQLQREKKELTCLRMDVKQKKTNSHMISRAPQSLTLYIRVDTLEI
jgi:hypothetical protein